jgi:hypothetical protein
VPDAVDNTVRKELDIPQCLQHEEGGISWLFHQQMVHD